MQSIAAICLRKFTAAHDSGPRSTKGLKWVVLHSTEGSTAAGAASWFQNPASEASTHLVVDDAVCYRTLPDAKIPWAAPGANEKGLHIEQAGFARWSRVNWLEHEVTIERAAYKAARWCHLYGIPARWVGPLGLRLGRKGITTHADVSKAWPNNAGNHWDPGPSYPKDKFMALCRGYLSKYKTAAA